MHTTTRLTRLTARPEGSSSTDHPRPERLLRGNPLRETWNLIEADLPAAQEFCGVWRLEN
ncbi:MAG: hypothetical protein ACR2JA_02980 [Hydrogenophaga sp.]|uniref:hypothetical protein n=1 Tax=Hydrogenophaga sp. TaxID=1904254 RepID=UPI003D9B77F3